MSSAGPFIVIAEVRVKPGSMDAFPAAAEDDARHSVADETGCRRFGVVRPDGDGNAVLFHEVYDSRAAFDAHLGTAHLERFRAAFPLLITEERPVRFGTRRVP